MTGGGQPERGLRGAAGRPRRVPVALGAAALALAAGAGGWRYVNGPLHPGAREVRYIRVRPGESAAAIGRQLQAAGVVRSGLFFAWWSRLGGRATAIKAGTYRLSPAMTATAILARMVRGQVAVVRVVLPEGLTVRAAVARLERAGIGSPAAWAAALRRPPAGIPPAPGVRDPWEGYVFPATYTLPWGAGPRAALGAALAAFRRETAGAAPLLARQHWTLTEWVTLASLVQAEGNQDPATDARIAAVFENRLARGMPLQSDASVRYALGDPPSGPLDLQDLTVPSPYNTYRYRGLPPGPICNPGAVALQAALHPARVGYLYFVSTPDGRFLFADTYAQQLQHLRALAPARLGK
ncbi:Endolytic murein transglycosylase [Candidatus Hydrogenisulfobacillus filiaventi]|uniref:Endolytic murein transglycosylase n=1 Tax=Candidatus Hydrogenisulfobacillus filiaventi TaxID=2707344 RepID=A0A6F8ZGR8_9FIRM|nr:endolytic transglycosylase MltG [Bacillota bacterium]CAB1128952.1 Endolytic murein transglycosylase [Candidatus Hydrogenisulfobacillus filiaventi]